MRQFDKGRSGRLFPHTTAPHHHTGGGMIPQVDAKTLGDSRGPPRTRLRRYPMRRGSRSFAGRQYRTVNGAFVSEWLVRPRDH
jgi:hypothetical protein